MAHTPGPWAIGQDFNHETALISTKTGDSVARAAWNGGSSCELEIDNPADARLIAEAPAMLEALRKLVCELGAVHRSDRFASADDALDEARAILARIEGN